MGCSALVFAEEWGLASWVDLGQGRGVPEISVGQASTSTVYTYFIDLKRLST